ncbi:MAG: hypothetical protein M3430_01665 [Acidobacteriota bacterium]|nr:hypothetical protein [Acidobacteriota bacterium]
MFRDVELATSLLLLLAVVVIALLPSEALRMTWDIGAAAFNLIWGAGGSVVNIAASLFG